MKNRFLQIHPADNVMVALTDLKKGEIIEFAGDRFPLQDDVAAKHKFMLRAFQPVSYTHLTLPTKRIV